MNNKNLRSIVVGLVLLTLVGCSTLEYVPFEWSKPETLRSELTVGETVIVRLNSGGEREFRIRALETDAIVGRGVRIAYTDILSVNVKTRDYAGTAKTALAVTALAAVYVGLAILEAEAEPE